jgi:replicative DNA helicase
LAQRAPLEAIRPLNRIPPHNLDAEQSVLGAMLESKEAIASVVEVLEADHFYKPAHTQIYEIILELYGRGEPADAITVADELGRRGVLDSIGGKPYIHGLLEAYPTAASAGRYARIVEEHALLRRLVEAGNQVQELGFSLPEDVEDAVDRAEEIVYQVGDRRLRDDLQPIRRLLTENMESIETLYERGENITGLASGFPDLDDMTAGFQPSTLVIVAARPSMGKCLAGPTLVDDPATGERVSLRDYVAQRRHRVLGVGMDGRLRVTEVSDWIPNGKRECWRITTLTGRSIVATNNHPFLTVEGWVPLAELRPGTRIAVPHKVSVFGNENWSEEKARLLGYLIAEGGLTASCPMFTNTDPEIIEDFRVCVEATFPSCALSHQGLSLRIRGRERWKRPNAATAWLRTLDLMGRRATEKFFPDVVWRLPRRQLAELLRALFSCDGTVYPMNGYARIEFTVASRQLALDVQHALLRFGIVSKFWQKTAMSWRVEITQPDSVDRYQLEIGWIGEKSGRSFIRSNRRRRSNCGHLPSGVWKFVRKALAAREMSLSELARRAGEAQNLHTRRGLPQRKLAIYAEILDDDDLRFLASAALYWDEVVRIESVGRHDVYDISVPDGNNFVAADICVHNSSLLNDFALHAATRQQVPVVIFSLEMSRHELVQRFLASEAKVDSQRIRRGALQEQDWTRLSSALGRLAEAPIFIDDSANITLMEMRAKCRRLKARHGLGLVIVDYLQLMQSPRRSENRQQEVSEISRALKIFARELKVPVVCASQLNRGVEYRADKRPLLGDLRESGCLTGDTLVALASGDQVPISSLVGTSPEITTLDGWRMASARAVKVWRTGHKKIFRLTTSSGRWVRATANHPFLTLDGWKRLDELQLEERIAISRSARPAGSHSQATPTSTTSSAHVMVAEEKLAELFSADLAWDRVRSVVPEGTADVFDMTVAKTHNFVANNIVVHNSIEQDSDMVMFIYRDEVYNPDSEARGEAELIMAKHRNGPTGMVRLAFMNQYTKFASIARGVR